MPVILIVEKSGSIKELSYKDFNENELYKKAGFKKADGFILQTVFKQKVNNKSFNIHLYGKTCGRAGTENKYDFPPPVDSTLFFGSCVLLNNAENGSISDISKVEWLQIYEKLFGGFEDIGSEDSEEEPEELDEDVPKTKDGYVKDDFVVDDEDEEEEEEDEDDAETELLEDTDETETEEDIEDEFEDDEPEEDDEDEEDEDENDVEDDAPKKKTNKKKLIIKKKGTPIVEKIIKTVKSNKKTIEKKRAPELSKSDTNSYLNCSNELMEEEYI